MVGLTIAEHLLVYGLRDVIHCMLKLCIWWVQYCTSSGIALGNIPYTYDVTEQN